MKELLDRFSVERLEEIIGRAEFWGHGAGYTPCEVIALARIALAVKQAEPVCWAYTRDLPDLRKGHGVRIHGWGPNRRMMATPYQVQNSSPLYEVPPVEALPQPITVDLKDVDVDAVKQAFAKGMDRYSGAMLTIAAPAPQPVAVPDLSSLKRYDLDQSDCDSCGQDCGADMSEEPDGDYVLFADVVSLLTSAPENAD